MIKTREQKSKKQKTKARQRDKKVTKTDGQTEEKD